MTRDEQWLLEEKYHGAMSPEFATDRERLAAGEPLAYVIGSQPFLGLKIALDSRPLIPRSETEWWVEQMLAHTTGEHSKVFRSASARGTAIFQQKNTRPSDFARRVRVLDLCAGSGAIGCAVLARIPNAHVSFGEIDPAHEATMYKNIRDNNLDETRASVRIGDLFTPFAGKQFDIIAINPPYIPADRELDSSVIEHEPHTALFSGVDGLDLIRHIAAELPRYLAPGGTAWIECDSAHAEAARDLFLAQGFPSTILTDHYGRPRVIRI